MLHNENANATNNESNISGAEKYDSINVPQIKNFAKNIETAIWMVSSLKIRGAINKQANMYQIIKLCFVPNNF